MSEGASHQGPWRELRLAAVPEMRPISGAVLAQAIMPTITAWFGRAWFEGGWCALRFASPAFDNERIRDEGRFDIASSELALRLVTDHGREVLSGCAGLGWRPPRLAISYELHDRCQLHEDQVRELLVRAGDHLSWYLSDSPWGGAVVPPVRFLRLAMEFSRERLRAELQPAARPMWSAMELSVRAPLRYATEYSLKQRVVARERVGHAQQLGFELEVTAGESVAACGRYEVKWLDPSVGPDAKEPLGSA